MNADLLNKFSGIKILLMDLEGVVIDNNESSESFNSRINNLKKFCSEIHELGLKFGIVTGRSRDEITETISGETDCFIITSSLDKVGDVEKLLKKHGFGFDVLMFIGDGILDVPLLKKAKLSAAPPSARREVKRAVNLILKGKNASELVEEVLNYFRKSKLNAKQ